MPELPIKLQKKICAACNGTGKNSKGGDCHPCLVHGRIKLSHVKNMAEKSKMVTKKVLPKKAVKVGGTNLDLRGPNP